MDNLPKDPFMLLSTVNMKLRDEYASLEELCLSLDVNQAELEEKMGTVGFEYMPAINQFR